MINFVVDLKCLRGLVVDVVQKALWFYFGDFELPIELMIRLEIHSFRDSFATCNLVYNWHIHCLTHSQLFFEASFLFFYVIIVVGMAITLAWVFGIQFESLVLIFLYVGIKLKCFEMNIVSKALVVDKISAIVFLESFSRLVGQPLPPVRLWTNHSAQVTKPPPSHTPWTQISHLLSSFRRWKNYKGIRLLVWIVWKLSSFWMQESCYTCHYWQRSISFLQRAFQKPFPLGWFTHSLKGAMPPNLTTTKG